MVEMPFAPRRITKQSVHAHLVSLEMLRTTRLDVRRSNVKSTGIVRETASVRLNCAFFLKSQVPVLRIVTVRPMKFVREVNAKTLAAHKPLVGSMRYAT